MFGLAAVHQGNGDAMCELTQETYHLVMLLRAEPYYTAESEYASHLTACLDCSLGVGGSGGDYVVGSCKDIGIGILHAIDFTSGHRVCPYELYVRTEHALNVIDH